MTEYIEKARILTYLRQVKSHDDKCRGKTMTPAKSTIISMIEAVESWKGMKLDGWEIDGYEVNIACSNWVMFKPRDRMLIKKMFRITLDDYIKKAKKSHRIMLKCLWKNIGCYKKGEVV